MKKIIVMLAVTVLALGVFAQVKIQKDLKKMVEAKPQAKEISPQDKIRLDRLKLSRENISRRVTNAAQRLEALDKLDHEYFNEKYGETEFDQFKGMKIFIQSNGYAQIEDLLMFLDKNHHITVEGKNIIRIYLHSIEAIRNLSGLDALRGLKSFQLVIIPLTRITGLEKNAEMLSISISSSDIEKIEGLEKMPKLKKLELVNSRLTTISGLGGNSQLEELYLYNNQISRISGMDNLKKLNKLKLQGNKITTRQDVSHLDRVIANNPQVKIELDGNPLNCADAALKNWLKSKPQIVSHSCK